MAQELLFAPLGGVGEIGMNLSVYGLGDARRREWLAVDLGVSFAGDDLPGVDLIMPDIAFLIEERRNIAGLVLTHAHEDHFGALHRFRHNPGGQPSHGPIDHARCSDTGRSNAFPGARGKISFRQHGAPERRVQ